MPQPVLHAQLPAAAPSGAPARPRPFYTFYTYNFYTFYTFYTFDTFYTFYTPIFVLQPLREPLTALVTLREPFALLLSTPETQGAFHVWGSWASGTGAYVLPRHSKAQVHPEPSALNPKP